jgi:hypothetical protein
MDPNLTSSPITSSPITSSPISSSQDNDLNKASDYLLNVYDKLTYGDLYGSSVLIVIISTIVIIFAVCFSMLIQNKQEIADNWTNLRCKPQYMPFAGYIMPEEGKTPGQTSYENFQYCLQEQVVNMTTEATKPHVYLLNALNSTFVLAGNAANNLRYGMTEMRTNIGAFASDLLSRIMNVTAPIYKMFLAVKDIVGKIQGALTAGLFIFDGAFKALQAFIGAFFMIIVSVLGIQLAIIAVLWILPLTIPMAMSLSIPIAIFAIFFAVLTGLTAKIFNINPIKIPSINVCFDKNTLFTMDDGETKKIINVNAGDILADGTKVTAKFKIDTCGSRMFSLGGVIVSETHIVKYSDKWIYVCEHPEAIEIRGYKEHDVRLEKVQNKINSRNLFDIHRKLDIGFSSDFVVELISENKNICDVNIGDKLKTGGIVYGLVEIDGSDLMLYDKLYDTDDKLYDDKLYNLLSTNKKFSSNGKVINDYNHIIDSIG